MAQQIWLHNNLANRFKLTEYCVLPYEGIEKALKKEFNKLCKFQFSPDGQKIRTITRDFHFIFDSYTRRER